MSILVSFLASFETHTEKEARITEKKWETLARAQRMNNGIDEMVSTCESGQPIGPQFVARDRFADQTDNFHLGDVVGAAQICQRSDRHAFR